MISTLEIENLKYVFNINSYDLMYLIGASNLNLNIQARKGGVPVKKFSQALLVRLLATEPVVVSGFFTKLYSIHDLYDIVRILWDENNGNFSWEKLARILCVTNPVVLNLKNGKSGKNNIILSRIIHFLCCLAKKHGEKGLQSYLCMLHKLVQEFGIQGGLPDLLKNGLPKKCVMKENIESQPLQNCEFRTQFSNIRQFFCSPFDLSYVVGSPIKLRSKESDNLRMAILLGLLTRNTFLVTDFLPVFHDVQETYSLIERHWNSKRYKKFSWQKFATMIGKHYQNLIEIRNKTVKMTASNVRLVHFLHELVRIREKQGLESYISIVNGLAEEYCFTNFEELLEKGPPRRLEYTKEATS